MKQLNRIVAFSLVVVVTIIGITLTTLKSHKMKHLQPSQNPKHISLGWLLH
jgi:hypothetical protein